MPTNFLQKLFLSTGKTTVSRAFLSAEHWPERIYAIGDVHGCHAELDALETKIIHDCHGFDGEKWIVMLGDYVDRGPDSSGVLERLCGPAPKDFRRICLAGNHEIMMLQFLAAPDMNSDWLQFGGTETLLSYGINVADLIDVSMQRRMEIFEQHIPRKHVDFMHALPLGLSLPGVTFVHAGVRPGIELHKQVEADLIWIREPFLHNSASLPYRVVHGHTPANVPEITGQRIGIDTRAFSSGILTSLRISADFSFSFIDTKIE